MTDFLAKAWFVNVPSSFPSLSTSFGRENDAFLFSLLLILKTSVLRWTNQCQVSVEMGRWIKGQNINPQCPLLLRGWRIPFSVPSKTDRTCTTLPPAFFCHPHRPAKKTPHLTKYPFTLTVHRQSRSTAACNWKPNYYSLAYLQPSQNTFQALKLAVFFKERGEGVLW